MRAIFAVFLSLLVLHGCLDSGLSWDSFGLKSDDELKQQFGCDIGVERAAAVKDVLIWRCMRDIENLDDPGPYGYGIYEVDAHPAGFWAVTYIVYDGEDYLEMVGTDGLEHYLAPIDNEEDALTYTYLREGLNMLETIPGAADAGESNARIEDGAFIVTVLHEDWTMCPCYGVFYKSVYRLSPNGGLEELSSDIVYDFEGQAGCVC